MNEYIVDYSVHGYESKSFESYALLLEQTSNCAGGICIASLRVRGENMISAPQISVNRGFASIQEVENFLGQAYRLNETFESGLIMRQQQRGRSKSVILSTVMGNGQIFVDNLAFYQMRKKQFEAFKAQEEAALSEMEEQMIPIAEELMINEYCRPALMVVLNGELTAVGLSKKRGPGGGGLRIDFGEVNSDG